MKCASQIYDADCETETLTLDMDNPSHGRSAVTDGQYQPTFKIV